jgi:epoxyqueuosine reductase
MSQEQQYTELAEKIRTWAAELGFQQLGISDVELGEHPAYLERWLDAGYHGEMDYMAKHGKRRGHPDQLLPGTLRVLSLRMDYLSGDTQPLTVLEAADKAYISRYTLGRDYHKLIRKRLAQLAKRIEAEAGGSHRAFVASAPVLERAIAEQAGLGWIAKNTMLGRNLHRPATARGPATAGKTLRQLPGLPGRVPHRCLCRAIRTGRPTLYFLPHH